MTPAIQLLKKATLNFTLHEYTHDPTCTSFGLEAAEKMNVDSKYVFKTLVIEFQHKQLAVAIIPVAKHLNMKMAAKALNSKKATMAHINDVERSTGYLLGGISPLGQKKRLTTLIDSSAASLTTFFVSAGRKGLELELSPNDLKQLCHAHYVPLSD